MSSTNAYNNYLKQQVEGASQVKLIMMMYDAVIRFCREASECIVAKNIEEAHNNIIRAENIVYELMSTLNMEQGGEVAQELMRIYDFVVWHLVDANTQKNIDKLEEVIKIITPIRDAWKELALKELAAAKEQTAPEKPSPEKHKSLNVAG